MYHFAFPLAMYERSCFSTNLPAFGVVSVLDFGHPDRCVMISRFNMYFSGDICWGAFGFFLNICTILGKFLHHSGITFSKLKKKKSS